MILPDGHMPDDTTGDTRWQPVMVAATLATPAVGLDTHPLHLDGPAAWGAYQQYLHEAGHGKLPPASSEYAIDWALPMATWVSGGTWGWACSRARYEPVGHGTSAMRRPPATAAMTRYTADAKHHLSAGPMKARDTPLQTTLVDVVTWHALADPAALRALLERVWSLGRLGRHGHGHIREWTLTPGPDRDAWRDRVMPRPDGIPQGIRAPYHHPTRKVPAC